MILPPGACFQIAESVTDILRLIEFTDRNEKIEYFALNVTTQAGLQRLIVSPRERLTSGGVLLINGLEIGDDTPVSVVIVTEAPFRETLSAILLIP